MQDSNLVKIFKTFSNEEFKHLRKFTQSDFFNTDTNLLLLFDALAKHYPGFNSKAMNKENLFGKVFGRQTYNDAKWRNLVFKMNKLTEDYLVWLELTKADTIRQRLLTNAFGSRNLYQKFEKSTTELTEKLQEHSLKTADALKERMQANLQFYHHPQTAKVDNLDKLQSAMSDLDHYYFAEKLRLACDLKVAENMVAGETPILLIEEISQLVQREQVRDLDYLKIYERVFDLLTQHPTMDAFKNAFDFVTINFIKLSEADRQFGLLHLLNFAINQTNKGETAFRIQLMELYKFGLKQGALLTEGNISDNTFINIVSTATGLKEFEWTLKFIIEYEGYLPQDGSKETTTLSYGYLYFHQKAHNEVINLLNNFSFQNFNKLLSSKNLLLRSYFELFLKDNSFYTVFTSYAKAYIKFVNREKQLSLVRKTWYKNLIFTTLNVAKHKYEFNWNKLLKEKIHKDILSKPMYLKAWLLERIEEL